MDILNVVVMIDYARNSYSHSERGVMQRCREATSAWPAATNRKSVRRSLPDNIGGAPSMSRSDRQIDPLVWSGRVLQENFDELAVSGLASMYPASHDGVSVKG